MLQAANEYLHRIGLSVHHGQPLNIYERELRRAAITGGTADVAACAHRGALEGRRDLLVVAPNRAQLAAKRSDQAAELSRRQSRGDREAELALAAARALLRGGSGVRRGGGRRRRRRAEEARVARVGLHVIRALQLVAQR